jgi:serine/threonine protein kinase
MAASLIGRQIGRYKVVAELGRGQHSVVYKAWQQSLERYVALKVLHRKDQNTLRKFQAEALLTADLIQRGATNIRQVYEVGQTADGCVFVAMEYVDESLRSLLRRSKQRKRLMNPAAVASLLMPVAQALDAIHSMGWVHLDIKPQNILISNTGRTLIADLGIAQRRGLRTHACTPIYASPEQADGDRPVGPWSDIYSLGVVVYEMVTGRPPFLGDLDIVILNKHLTEDPRPPRSVNTGLSSSQDRTILKALAKSPKDRHRTATEFLQAMLRVDTIISSILEARNTVFGRPGLKRQAPRLALIGGLLILLAALLLVVGWIVWPMLFHGPSTPAATERPETAVPTTSVPTALPSATATRETVATALPSPTTKPTSTLAPTPTRTPRPAPTRTRPPTPTTTPPSAPSAQP